MNDVTMQMNQIYKYDEITLVCFFYNLLFMQLA